MRAQLDAAEAAFLSHASIWELSIKHAQGRQLLPAEPQEYLHQRLADQTFDLLTISLEHIFNASDLPLIHRDPFDRILVAQAQAERLTLVTSDRLLADYDVPTLLV